MAVTSDYTPVVTLLTGHDEDSYTMSGLESVLSLNNYTIEELNITASEDFNEESTIAVIPAPLTDYSELELDRLRTWLENDGSLDRSLVVLANFEANCPNLYEFLNVEYGIEVTSNLVVETSDSRMYSYMPYNPYADIETSDFTSDLSGDIVLTPVCVQLLTNGDDDTSSSLYNVDVVTFPETAQIYPIEDSIQSIDENQTSADEYPIVGVAYANQWALDSDNVSHYTNVLVSGSCQMFIDEVLSMTSVENEDLLLNFFNGFTGNDNTVSIASLAIEQDTLEFNTAQINIFLFVFVIAIPLTLLIVSLLVFLRRRRL
jgi:hypothetical protein